MAETVKQIRFFTFNLELPIIISTYKFIFITNFFISKDFLVVKIYLYYSYNNCDILKNNVSAEKIQIRLSKMTLFAFRVTQLKTVHLILLLLHLHKQKVETNHHSIPNKHQPLKRTSVLWMKGMIQKTAMNSNDRIVLFQYIENSCLSKSTCYASHQKERRELRHCTPSNSR